MRLINCSLALVLEVEVTASHSSNAGRLKLARALSELPELLGRKEVLPVSFEVLCR